MASEVPTPYPIKMEATIATKGTREIVISDTSDEAAVKSDPNSPLVELSKQEHSITSKQKSTSSKRVTLRMGQPPVLGVGAEEQLMEKREELNKIMQ